SPTAGGALHNAAFLNIDHDSSDVWAEATVQCGNHANADAGVSARIGKVPAGLDAGKPSIHYSYSVTLAPNTLRLFKGVSVLETDATLSASANTSYVLRIEAEGSTIRGFFGGALTLSTTDATYTAPNVRICARWPDASNRGRVYSI